MVTVPEDVSEKQKHGKEKCQRKSDDDSEDPCGKSAAKRKREETENISESDSTAADLPDGKQGETGKKLCKKIREECVNQSSGSD